MIFRCRLTDGHTDKDLEEIEIVADRLWAGMTPPQHAACKYCEGYDQSVCEYPSEREVIVVTPDGSRQTFTVLQCAVPEYWVDRKRAVS